MNLAASLSRAQTRALLARIESWGCQYQNIEPDRIAGSSLDLIVIDPVLDGGTGRTADQADIQKLQRKPDGGRRLVFAYLSIGAAEEYRAYWNDSWLTAAPEWLGPHDPVWPRSHAVRFWRPDWQRIVTEGLQRIVAAGFDGVFLDRADAYHDWSGTRPAALDEMADFVVQLAQSARQTRPGFLMVGQNAEHLLEIPRYLDAIDGVSKESLLTGLEAQTTFNSADKVAWSMKYLVQAQRAGLVIMTIEYLEAAPDIEVARQRHQAMRFKPFFGQRLLDKLP